MAQQQQHHYLLVSCPAQGHMNPTLQLAKLLLRTGAHVTFATTVNAHRRMLAASTTLPALPRLSYATYSDGFDDGLSYTSTTMDQIQQVGSRSLSNLIVSLHTPTPVTCLIYAVLLPWAADVARDHRIPSALLWIQPASVFTLVHHHFFHHVSFDVADDKSPSVPIKLQGLPPLSYADLPTFFHASSPHSSVVAIFKHHFQSLLREEDAPMPMTTKSTVLVNSFDSLEGDAIRAVDEHYDVFAVGPLVPALEEERSYGCDMFKGVDNDDDYIEWLNSKPKSSVVYVSFGSMVEVKRRQTAEILRGLVESGRPFLWAVRSKKFLEEEFGEGYVSGAGTGLVVEWCSQVKVLSHESVGCFVSHCGWNSALESVACGVPMVGCAQWSDQTTVAMMVEEVWKIGVRAKRVSLEQSQEEEGGESEIVESEEIKRCVEMVMGVGGEEMRRNAWSLRDLVKESKGSSFKRVQEFAEKIHS